VRQRFAHSSQQRSNGIRKLLWLHPHRVTVYPEVMRHVLCAVPFIKGLLVESQTISLERSLRANLTQDRRYQRRIQASAQKNTERHFHVRLPQYSLAEHVVKGLHIRWTFDCLANLPPPVSPARHSV